MRLNKLELHGFKSFFHQTALSFSPGISAVVGPNGCGKSNIADAIRWVMGEQSPKRLRGRSMDDIIFAGTAANRSMGYAEVSLSVTRTNGPFPTPFHHYEDLTVTRRLYRSGESEYLINRVPCRLKDIVGLFMDTGLGARGYAIIEQGSIGRIIDSGPEERRAWIEEAAGIVKFKAQRQAALRKMDQTGHNLDRVADVLEEVKRQAAGLKRQAGKAERYRTYNTRLRELELALAAREYDAVLRQVARLEADLRSATDRREITAARESAVSAALEADRLRLTEQEGQLHQHREERHRISGQIQALEKTEEHLRDRTRDLDARQERDRARLAEEDKRLEELAAEQTRLTGRRERLREEVEERREERDALQERLDEIHDRAQAKAEAVSRTKDRLIDLASERSRAHNAALSAGERLDSLDARRSRLSAELDRAESDRTDLEGVFRERQRSLEEAEARLETLTEQLEQLNFDHQDAADELALARAGRDRLSNELSRVTSQLEGLQDLAEAYEGVDEGVKALLDDSELAGQTGGRPFSGLVAEGIEAPEDLEQAVEAALSGAAMCLVASDSQTALAAARRLITERTGRAGLTAPDLLSFEPETGSAPQGCSLLADRLAFSGPSAGAARALIGPCLLAPDLETALAAWQSGEKTRPVVTPGGEFISPPGLILAGGGGDKGASLLARQRMIRQLSETVEGLRSQLDQAGSLTAEAEERAAMLAERINELKALRRRDEALKNEADKEAAGLKIRLTELERRTTVLAAEIESLAEEETGLRREQARQTGLKERLEEEQAALEDDLALAEADARSASGEAGEIREELTGARVALTRLTGLMDQLKQSADRTEADRQRTGQAIQRLSDDLTGADREREEIKTRSIRNEEELKLFTRQVMAADQKIAREQERLSLVQEELRERAEQAKGLREDLKEAEQAVGQADMSLSKAGFSRDKLVEETARLHQADLAADYGQHLDLEMDVKAARDEADSLQGRIQRLGPINPTAVEEYQALVERREFLEKEVNDLTSSMNDLRSAIRKISKTTLERFSETFKSVAAKMEYLGPILFGEGASIQLVLNEPDNPLDSGIDLKVQPPGKRLTNMGLLSGGEKALAAATLLFAIFLHRPSPFCLLDEVDAPLDENNVDRFSKLVKEIGRHSQILMITHNRRTMEMVDTLYGVTMPEPGVSRMVSVRLQGDEDESSDNGLV